MAIDLLPPSLVACYAYVEGISENKVKTLISVKALPANGRSYRTLCKWPRQTAKGYDDRGEFWWATVERRGDDVFVRPSKTQANSVSSADDNLCVFALLLTLWLR